MALPPTTPEQRAEALRKATQARAARAGLRESLKNGSLTVAGALARADGDDAIGKMKVSAVIESLPGMGKVKTAHLMDRLGIAANRRVRGLSARQRTALKAALDPVPA